MGDFRASAEFHQSGDGGEGGRDDVGPGGGQSGDGFPLLQGEDREFRFQVVDFLLVQTGRMGFGRIPAPEVEDPAQDGGGAAGDEKREGGRFKRESALPESGRDMRPDRVLAGFGKRSFAIVDKHFGKTDRAEGKRADLRNGIAVEADEFETAAADIHLQKMVGGKIDRRIAEQTPPNGGGFGGAIQNFQGKPGRLRHPADEFGAVGGVAHRAGRDQPDGRRIGLPGEPDQFADGFAAALHRFRFQCRVFAGDAAADPGLDGFFENGFHTSWRRSSARYQQFDRVGADIDHRHKRRVCHGAETSFRSAGVKSRLSLELRVPPLTLARGMMERKSHSTPDGYPEIEDYGIIGDLRTAALVGLRGSIDFMCFPEFDSPSIFCANVDRERGGRFQIEPLLEDVREKHLYLPDTNVLITRFLSAGGVAEISNYMVLSEEEEDCEQALVRRAKCVHGSVRFRLCVAPRFNYAQSEHTVHEESSGCLRFESGGPDGLKLRLHSDVPLEIRDSDGYAEFTLTAGEKASFVLEEADQASPCDRSGYSRDSFKKTCDYWRSWIGKCTYNGRWREAVHRSALALKLLTSRRHGSIIASPCFGFPNEVGGERNWDYRYTWIRDASFSTYALMRIGFTEEAESFMRWLEARIKELAEGEILQTMYRIDGSKLEGEFHLGGLEGYRQSLPIRIGSTNHDQLQLDIFGEVMDSVYLFDKYGSPISHDLWKSLRKLVEYVCRHWQDADAGIWEVRGGPCEFLFSRVLCWVAVDRAIRLAHKRGLPAPVERWREERDRIYEDVFENFWDSGRGAFVQFKGTTALDASTLIMPLVRMISPTDPKFLSTLQAISEDLVEDSLVYRYNVGEAFSDELEGGEGTFSICSYWYIECISRAGDLQKARYLFEKMLGYSNSVGLFSEQLGSRGEFLGNVPQAFTHLAMISAAYDLDRKLSGENSPRIGGGKG